MADDVRTQIATLLTGRCNNCYRELPGHHVKSPGWHWLTPNFGPFCDDCYKEVAPSHTVGVATVNDDAVICIGGSILISRVEVENAQDIMNLLRWRAGHIKESYLLMMIKEINKRGWAILPEQEKTDG